jgi:hypothetical protein
MADLLETVDKTETVLIIGGILAIGYFLYKAGGAFSDFINNLTGASAENTYTNAASQTLAHPIQTIGTIAGGITDDFFSSSPAPNPSGMLQPLSTLSSTGYVKIGASGQHWSCSGPQGQPNDVCVPVTVDASGNMTTTGASVLAANAN